jgi:hypothetical protein
LDTGRYEEDVPDSILAAINSLDVMDEDTACGIVSSFYNQDWQHPDVDGPFYCSERFAAALMARQRNLHVAGIKSGFGGDIFGLYENWVDEVYLDWFGGVACGYPLPEFERAMNERGWSLVPEPG